MYLGTWFILEHATHHRSGRDGGRREHPDDPLYERRGLFAAPKRTPAGYRQYAEDAVARLRFIKHAQDLGFSLREIEELLALRVRHGAACDTVERKTRKKIEVV